MYVTYVTYPTKEKTSKQGKCDQLSMCCGGKYIGDIKFRVTNAGHAGHVGSLGLT
jgi:hypothetical protein